MTPDPDRPHVMLDLDGVLNTRASVAAAHREGWRASGSAHTLVDGSHAAPVAACVDRLDALIEATGALVVVTSSWRTDKDVDALRACLRDEFGLRNWDAVIGRTALPDMDTRAHQVSDWVGRAGVRNHVVLDDVEVPFKRQRRRWVMVDPDAGLSDADVGRCLRILAPEPRPRPSP